MEVLDLFENQDNLPQDVREIIKRYANQFASDGDSYELCRKFEAELKPYGYCFEWGLDAVPQYLRQITYTHQDVTRMLLSVLTFANANANKLHGTKTIKGKTYGEQVRHIIDMYNESKDNTIDGGLDDGNWSLLRLTPKLSE